MLAEPGALRLVKSGEQSDHAEQGRIQVAKGTPTRTGGSSGAPEVIITPLSAWTTVSSPCPRRARRRCRVR